MLAGNDGKALRIGEVADRVGVTTRTIRYYEELGLLVGGDREKGSHRLYSEADVTRLTELVRLRELLGLSLNDLVMLAEAEEARAVLREKWRGDPSDLERVEILDRSIALLSNSSSFSPRAGGRLMSSTRSSRPSWHGFEMNAERALR